LQAFSAGAGARVEALVRVGARCELSPS
jgi:hypothetical protein